MGRRAFTLVELLTVIAIIGVLVALLVPTVRHALAPARGGKSLRNLRQLAMGVELYATDNKGFLPAGAYPAPPTPRVRWTDAIWPYMSMREMYLSPQLSGEEMQRMLTPFAHDPNMTCGGYGYNDQYLGNGRHVATWSEPYKVPFHARVGSAIQSPANMLLISDTEGAKAEQIDNAGGQTMASPWSKRGVYTIDPPLASKDLGSRGARIKPREPRKTHHHRDRRKNLHHAQQEGARTQRAQPCHAELGADREEQRGRTQLGEHRHTRLGTHPTQHTRAHERAREQIPKHRSLAKPLGQRAKHQRAAQQDHARHQRVVHAREDRGRNRCDREGFNTA